MKFGVIRSVAHNIADSFASGIGLMIGVFQMDVFMEAAGEPTGFVVVDFLAGDTKATTVSSDCRKAISLYRDALPEFCEKHGVAMESLSKLEVRYGTDSVYGRHFTVTVETRDGRQAVDRFLGVPGKRLHKRH